MFLKTKSGLIYYEVYGSQNAPAVIFTHGGGLNGGMFNAQITALKNNYRVITWDIQGHGRSAPLERSLDVVKMADYLVEIMKDIKIESY